MNIRTKVGLILLLPALGALLSVLSVYRYHKATEHDLVFVHVAGHQQAIAHQLYDYAHMVLIGQEEDQAGLSQLVKEFDGLLAAMIDGGVANQHALPPAQGSGLNRLLYIKDSWRGLKNPLNYIATHGHKDPRSKTLFKLNERSLRQLPVQIAQTIETYESRSRDLYDQTMIVIGAIAVFVMVVLALAFWMFRQYVRERNENEEKLAGQARIIDAIHDGVISISQDQVFLSWNDGARRMFGYSVDEILGKCIADFYSPEECQFLQENLFDPAISRGSHEMVFRARKKGGDQFYVHMSVTAQKDKDNIVCGLIAYIMDVTQQRIAERQLRESQGILRRVLDAIPVRVFWKDLNGVYLGCNRLFALDAGKNEPDEIVGKTDYDFQWREQAEQYRADDRTVVASGQAKFNIEEPQTSPEGGLLWLETSKVPLTDVRGEINGIMGVYQEVTARKKTTDVLQMLAQGVSGGAGEMFLRKLAPYINEVLQTDYVVISELKDRSSRIANTIVVCRDTNIEDNFEYSIDTTPCADLFDREVDLKIINHKNGETAYPFGDAIQYRSIVATTLKGSDGQLLGVISVMGHRPLHDENLAASIVQLFALRAALEMERKQSEDRLTILAHYDHLTGLPNRTLFFDRLTQTLSRTTWRNRKAAILFIDLDRFKIINDSLGHETGDLILCEVAKRLSTVVREGDTVARLGGDEFAVVLADLAKSEDVIRVGENILHGLKEPIVLNGREFFVTSSIGIAIYPDDADNAENLLRNADISMYRAKERGKNNYQLYSPAMSESAPQRLQMETDLRKSIERRDFELYYQPKINIRTGVITGVEALLRWHHPTMGIIGPVSFIPLLEETGLIVTVGKWILEEACRQNKAWQDRGLPPMTVAVNLSSRQFKQHDLVHTVDQALARSGLASQFLELEITESVLMDYVDETVLALENLDSKGVRISVDDFGTGYSSLSYLKQFPIASLKIDKSFVRDITTDPDDAAIVHAIIGLSHGMKLKVIAEGVETQAQLEYLRQHQCDEMQGYLFSEPVSASAIEQLFQSGGALLGGSGKHH